VWREGDVGAEVRVQRLEAFVSEYELALVGLFTHTWIQKVVLEDEVRGSSQDAVGERVALRPSVCVDVLVDGVCQRLGVCARDVDVGAGAAAGADVAEGEGGENVNLNSSSQNARAVDVPSVAAKSKAVEALQGVIVSAEGVALSRRDVVAMIGAYFANQSIDCHSRDTTLLPPLPPTASPERMTRHSSSHDVNIISASSSSSSSSTKKEKTTLRRADSRVF
jgi:hypothetical protein